MTVSVQRTNRPFKWGPNDRREFISTNGEVALRIQNDGSGNAIYVGRALVGTATSDAKWQISFLAYDSNNAPTSQTWPQNSAGNASADYEFVWDDRLTYTYS